MLILAAWAPLIERAQARNHVLDGVSMGGIDLSGATPAELIERLTALGAEVETRPIVARIGSSSRTIAPMALGTRFDMDATKHRALEAGFDTNPIAAAAGLVVRRFENDSLRPVVRIDEPAVQRLLDEWQSLPEVTLEEGSLTFDGGTVHVVAPKAGLGFDRDRARSMIVTALIDPRMRTMSIPLEQRQPNISESAVQNAAQRAQSLLAREYTIAIGPKRMTVNRAALAASLRTRNGTHSLELTIDQAALRTALSGQLKKIETIPRDATWSVNGKTASVVPSQSGKLVPLDQVAEHIMKGRAEISVTLDTVTPAHDTAWAKKLDISSMIGTYTTPFPAGEVRVTNIRVAARALNGSVVEPGATFSLNAKLGERTLEKGYVLAHSIAADLSFEDTVGGGVSQVSTTLYNATYAAGLQDVEHTAHSIYISRYPLGREATLTWPSIDNKFRNNLPTGILIRARVRNDSITVWIYGNSHGRRVVVHDPIQLKKIEITTNAVCKVNPDLRSGSRLQFPGTPGFEAEYSRDLISNDGTKTTERRNARYQMRPNRCEVGPDTPTSNPNASSSSSSGSSTTSRGAPTSTAPSTTTTTTPPPPSTGAPPTTTTTTSAPLPSG